MQEAYDTDWRADGTPKPRWLAEQPSDLYTPAQRARRDASIWTLIQAVLATIQFLVFLVSLYLVCAFLLTGDGYAAATVSVMIKTALLLLIMVTGAIWERAVFGQYLFAPAFFWEDVVSMLVIGLHILYVGAWLFDALNPNTLMWLALLAYASYLVNAAQFVIKFKQARRKTNPDTNLSVTISGNTKP
jgi:3-vinyl bacteriochlorophyllide hydratase